MLTRNVRRNKNNYSLKKVVVFWIVCLFFATTVSLGFFLFQKVKQRVYVSPVSKQNQDQTSDINTIKSLLSEKHVGFSFVSPIDSSSYLITLSAGEEVIITTKKPFIDQVSSLQLVLSRLTIEGKRVSRIDFRFDTPVLTER